jgi:beta-glucosidase
MAKLNLQQLLFGLKINFFATSTPWALKKMLEHLQVKYKNPVVMIHENGKLNIQQPSKSSF